MTQTARLDWTDLDGADDSSIEFDFGGFGSDQERDSAMTGNTDEDIAWIRPGRERSGTAKNLMRRARRG